MPFHVSLPFMIKEIDMAIWICYNCDRRFESQKEQCSKRKPVCPFCNRSRNTRYVGRRQNMTFKVERFKREKED